jgi:hypothetical protein
MKKVSLSSRDKTTRPEGANPCGVLVLVSVLGSLDLFRLGKEFIQIESTVLIQWHDSSYMTDCGAHLAQHLIGYFPHTGVTSCRRVAPTLPRLCC